MRDIDYSILCPLSLNKANVRFVVIIVFSQGVSHFVVRVLTDLGKQREFFQIVMKTSAKRHLRDLQVSVFHKKRVDISLFFSVGHHEHGTALS